MPEAAVPPVPPVLFVPALEVVLLDSGALLEAIVCTVVLPAALIEMLPACAVTSPRTSTCASTIATETASEMGSLPAVERTLSVTSVCASRLAEPAARMDAPAPSVTCELATTTPTASGMKNLASEVLEASAVTLVLALASTFPPASMMPRMVTDAEPTFTLTRLNPVPTIGISGWICVLDAARATEPPA